MCQVGIFHVLDGEVIHAQHVLNANLLAQHVAEVARKSHAGFLAHIGNDSVLIIRHHVYQCRVKDGLVAQHGVFCLLLTLLFLGNVARRSHDVARPSVLVTMQNGEDYNLRTLYALRAIVRLHYQRGMVFLLLYDVLEGLHDATEVC